MADVRSMLRGERNARKVKHSQAAYTSTGQLMCSVCRCPVKSAAVWDAHLQSDGHLALVQKIKQIRHSTPDVEAGGHKRKRKADADEPPLSKRSRNVTQEADGRTDNAPVSQPMSPTPGETAMPEEPAVPESTTSEAAQPEEETKRKSQKSEGGKDAAVDQNEWDAFERDMAQLEESEKKQASVQAHQSAPTISAAPVTAEQLAARAREEQSAQKGARENELEEEREDAERQMEEELGRMEQLDERMRNWRARREALQRAQAPPADAKQPDNPASAEASDESDDDEEDEDDAWRGLGGI